MTTLALFSILGIVPTGWMLWRLWGELQQMHERAIADKGFALRNASLGPAERKRWNEEFLSWRVFRVPLLLTLAEGFLLALALRIPSQLFQMWLFIALWQILPLGFVYFLHLWLLYRYGRFHLERVDKGQRAARQIAMLMFTLAAWMPLPATWCYVKWIVLATAGGSAGAH